MNQSERDRMLAGEWYHASDPELQLLLTVGQEKLRGLNSLPNEDVDSRFALLCEFFDEFGEGTQLRSPFLCDYGWNIHIGRNGFINYDCVFLDCNRIDIGDNVQIGPGVHIYTALHPVDPEQRRAGVEAALPVRIGNNVWIGGRSVICPGVVIGDDAVIGAGSVVVSDIPPGVVAVGTPCRPVRSVTAKDEKPRM